MHIYFFIGVLMLAQAFNSALERQKQTARDLWVQDNPCLEINSLIKKQLLNNCWIKILLSSCSFRWKTPSVRVSFTLT